MISPFSAHGCPTLASVHLGLFPVQPPAAAAALWGIFVSLGSRCPLLASALPMCLQVRTTLESHPSGLASSLAWVSVSTWRERLCAV